MRRWVAVSHFLASLIPCASLYSQPRYEAESDKDSGKPQRTRIRFATRVISPELKP